MGAGKPLADSWMLTDLLTRQFAGTASFTDNLALIEAVLKGSGTSTTDLLLLVDTLNRGYSGGRTSIESIIITDLFARQYGVQIFLSEILTITENLTAVYTSFGGPSTITINVQDLFNLNDLLGKLLTPAPFGVTGGTPGTVGPLVQIQLAAIPRIATLDYIAANPMSIQLFLFKPSSILQVLFTATNGTKDKQVVDIFFNIELNGKPYMTTPKSQQSLAPGIPTNIYSWLLIDQPGTYQIIPYAEAVPQEANFSTVTLPTQTIVVEAWQIWLATTILWLLILGPIIAVTVFATRAILTRRKEAKEAEE